VKIGINLTIIFTQLKQLPNSQNYWILEFNVAMESSHQDGSGGGEEVKGTLKDPKKLPNTQKSYKELSNE